MKKNLISCCGFGLFLFLFSLPALAQDWKSVNPAMARVLADGKLIRGTEIIMAPGEKSEMHTHPAHFFYALTDGKMMVHYKDGKDELIELKVGDAGVSDPERPHISENVGATTLRFLIVELKEHPYSSKKQM
jgi:oxalate decarboxylase/phosphoglucose isomerase-like protein (cupin superfamily)